MTKMNDRGQARRYKNEGERRGDRRVLIIGIQVSEASPANRNRIQNGTAHAKPLSLIPHTYPDI